MHYGKINDYDIANGIGIRISLFVSGCRIHCHNCFNKDSQDFNYGSEFTKTEEDHIIDQLNNPHISGLTILGGEPMEPENQLSIINLIRRVKSTYNNKTIWIYSGYTLETILEKSTEVTIEILNSIDVLVDGPFVESLKDLRLQFRGSSNQRLIDMNYWRTNKLIKELSYEE